jgi:hypothetical protein
VGVRGCDGPQQFDLPDGVAQDGCCAKFPDRSGVASYSVAQEHNSRNTQTVFPKPLQHGHAKFVVTVCLYHHQIRSVMPEKPNCGM